MKGDELGDEIWGQIPEFPKYWVSDQGRVVNLQTKRVLKAKKRNGFPYPLVRLNYGGKQYQRSVNALQKKAFVI